MSETEKTLQECEELAASFGWRVIDMGDGCFRYENQTFCGFSELKDLYQKLLEVKEREEKRKNDANLSGH